MPYARNRDLPDAVLGVLPEHAQEIYRQASDSAWDEYENARDRRRQSSREKSSRGEVVA